MIWIGVLLVLVAGCLFWWGSRGARALTMREVVSVPSAVGDAFASKPETRDWLSDLVEIAFVDIPPDRYADAVSMVAIISQTERRLKAMEVDPTQLPRRPELLPQILQVMKDENCTAQQLSDLIIRDPVLVANLLKLVNSAALRSRTAAIDSLDRAIVLLGTDGIRRVVAIAMLQPVMQVSGGGLDRLPALAWAHSQRAAEIAVQAGVSRQGDLDPQALQLMLLLRGLGGIMVIQALLAECIKHDAGIPEAVYVEDLLRRWSPRYAALVAWQWSLPDAMVQTLRGTGDDPALRAALMQTSRLAADQVLNNRGDPLFAAA
ncbi:MAG: HDOD domain-containing protein [Pseudomonadota bacterium]|nr:HDOD domain-containing protein [Pseudomonadota bacterium]